MKKAIILFVFMSLTYCTIAKKSDSKYDLDYYSEIGFDLNYSFKQLKDSISYIENPKYSSIVTKNNITDITLMMPTTFYGTYVEKIKIRYENNKMSYILIEAYCDNKDKCSLSDNIIFFDNYRDYVNVTENKDLYRIDNIFKYNNCYMELLVSDILLKSKGRILYSYLITSLKGELKDSFMEAKKISKRKK